MGEQLGVEGVRGQRALAREPARGLGHPGRVHARGDLRDAAGQGREIAGGSARAGQHQVGVQPLQGIDPFAGRHFFQGLGQGTHVGRLPVRERPDQLRQPGRARGLARLRQAQRGQRRPAGRRKPFPRGLDVLFAQPLQRGVRIRRRQRQTPAARHQGRQKAVRRIRHQQEDRVRGRFLQHLEQGVGRHHVQGMGRIQERHPPPAAVRGGVEPGFQRTDLVDAYFLGGRALGRAGGRLGVLGGLGGVRPLCQGHGFGPDAAQVGMVAAGEPGARGAMTAGQPVLGRFT
ncbi:hypothetical protein D9M68_650430 [compost metagenome]